MNKVKSSLYVFFITLIIVIAIVFVNAQVSQNDVLSSQQENIQIPPPSLLPSSDI